MNASISEAATFMRQRLHSLAKLMIIVAPGLIMLPTRLEVASSCEGVRLIQKAKLLKLTVKFHK
ncbi:hypothetical protein [Rhizobium laguerreae]|uniref:hypothetical protein n=1 Tax=Rhizobium laguerreae TaxID=1076926 RepID=UPI001C8FA91D|nr:hypothetical protein [Rhizobium laguerreae]MBY3224272.1 hypothetical protein [Rhizobium laguerreae]